MSIAVRTKSVAPYTGNTFRHISGRTLHISRDLLESVRSQSPPLPNMAMLVLTMVKDSLDSFVNRDPVAARNIIPRDREVDALNKDLHQHKRVMHGLKRL